MRLFVRKGSLRARSLSTGVALQTGLLTSVSTFGLLRPVVFAKTGGSSNLGIDPATGGVSATTALTAGQSQNLLGTATGADGCVIPFSLTLKGQASSAVIRVVPVSATEAYLVAPHATLGAIALHLTYGNGGDNSTPAASLGAPFGGWRIRGFRVLPSVSSNPATQASETIYDGGAAAGAQQIAINIQNVWGGHLHGGFTGYAQTAPDLTQAGMIAVTPITSSGSIAWSGATATFADSFTLNADGSITTSANVSLAADPFQAYLDMTIVGAGFTRASLDGGATWTDLTTLAVLPAAGYSMPANVASIMLRDPLTGTTATITDDALNGVAGRFKEIVRRAGDFKVYADLNPTPSGTHLGNVATTRTITFGKTAPDPAPVYPWDGNVNGDSGYTKAINSNIAFDATNKQIVLTQGAAGANNRVTFAMSGLTVGQAYRVSTIFATAGSSPAAGTTVNLSAASNGGSAIGLGDVSAGTPSYLFTATATTMWLSLHQAGVTGGNNVLRINRIGPVVPQ